MDQLEFFDIPSPCIGVCQAGKNGFCVGCFRSREERMYWHKTTPYAKRIIVKACKRRKNLAKRNKWDSAQETQSSPVQISFLDDDGKSN